MQQQSEPEGGQEQTLHLARSTREQVLSALSPCNETPPFHCLDISLLPCDVDSELVEQFLSACNQVPGGVAVRMAHNDLGSGTDDEQRIFELKAENELRENELKFHRKKKLASSKEKDFAACAAMRRTAEEGIDIVAARLVVLKKDMGELELRKVETPWYSFFSQLEAQNRNGVRTLDLSNCGLHATGLALLTHAMLELEQRGDGEKISELALDGNDLGDIGMTAIATLLRMSGHIEVLRLRNVGATEEGVTQIISGLVSNKSLALVDLRANGLCSAEVVKAAVDGVRRFNKTVEILIA